MAGVSHHQGACPAPIQLSLTPSLIPRGRDFSRFSPGISRAPPRQWVLPPPICQRGRAHFVLDRADSAPAQGGWGGGPQIEGNHPSRLIIRNPTARTATPGPVFPGIVSPQRGCLTWAQDIPSALGASLDLSCPSCLPPPPEPPREVPEDLGERGTHLAKLFLNCLWGFFPF